MKIFKYILTGFICLVSVQSALSQYYLKFKSDSVALESDSVKLTIDEYRGIINWQVSADLENWTQLNKNTDTLGIGIDSSAYYRAAIEDGTCNPVFSDSVFLLEKLTITDSNQFTVDSEGGVFLLPSGIKVKIPGGAVIEPKEIRIDALSADSVNNLAAIHIGENASFLSGISFVTDAFNFRKPIKIKIPIQSNDWSGLSILFELNSEIDSWLFSDETIIVSPQDKFIEIILKGSFQNEALTNGLPALDSVFKYFYLKYFNFPLLEDPFVQEHLKSEKRQDVEEMEHEDPCRQEGYKSESLDLDFENSGECVAASTRNKIIYFDCGPVQTESFEATEIDPSCEPELSIPGDCIKIKKDESTSIQLDTRIGNIPLAYQTIKVSASNDKISVPSHLTTLSDGNIPLNISGLEVGEAVVSLTVEFDYFLSTIKAIGAGISEASTYSNVIISKPYTLCVIVYDVPIVTTTFYTNDEDTRAFAGGEVTDDNEDPVTERGVYLDDLKLPLGEGLGSFEAELFDLMPNKTYTLKAYAINSAGTGYGEEVRFVLDIDGNIYRTVIIGEQEWMAENLKTTRLNDGTPIGYTKINPDTEHVDYYNDETGTRSWYDNLESNNKIYGTLYSVHAVKTKKLCPAGWHVPSENDFLILTDFAGGYEQAGGKFKAPGTTYWKYPNTGATNEFGLSALPGGLLTRSSDKDGERLHKDNYYFIGETGIWWTSTTVSGHSWDPHKGVYLSYDTSEASFGSQGNWLLHVSCRCIKD